MYPFVAGASHRALDVLVRGSGVPLYWDSDGEGACAYGVGSVRRHLSEVQMVLTGYADEARLLLYPFWPNCDAKCPDDVRAISGSCTGAYPLLAPHCEGSATPRKEDSPRWSAAYELYSPAAVEYDDREYDVPPTAGAYCCCGG